MSTYEETLLSLSTAYYFSYFKIALTDQYDRWFQWKKHVLVTQLWVIFVTIQEIRSHVCFFFNIWPQIRTDKVEAVRGELEHRFTSTPWL